MDPTHHYFRSEVWYLAHSISVRSLSKVGNKLVGVERLMLVMP